MFRRSTNVCLLILSLLVSGMGVRAQGPQEKVDRLAQRPGELRRGPHLVLARHRGRHEHGTCARGPGRLHVGADVADDGAALRIDAESRGGGKDEPGARLAAVAAVAGAVGTHEPRPERPEQGLDPRVDGVDLRRREDAARDPALVADDRQGQPRGAQAAHRGARARDRLDALGVAVVRHVDDQRPVTVEQDGVGTTQRAWSERAVSFNPPPVGWRREGELSGGVRGVRFVKERSVGEAITIGEMVRIAAERHGDFTLDDVLENVLEPLRRREEFATFERRPTSIGAEPAVSFEWSVDYAGRHYLRREMFVVHRGHLYVVRFIGIEKSLSLFERVVKSIEFPR